MGIASLDIFLRVVPRGKLRNGSATFSMSRNWVVIMWLVLATAGVYSRVATHDFVNYDDNDYVTDNPRPQPSVRPSRARCRSRSRCRRN